MDLSWLLRWILPAVLGGAGTFAATVYPLETEKFCNPEGSLVIESQ